MVFKKGYKMREEHKRKIGIANMHDNANEKSIHQWITKHKGRPQVCVDCGSTARETKLEWSNIDHKYTRYLDDYAGRCCSCHKKFDIKYNGYKIKNQWSKT